MLGVRNAGWCVVAGLLASTSLSCSEDSPPSAETSATAEAYDVSYQALSAAGLPKCTSSIAGTVGYVTQDSTLWKCDKSKLKWFQIECDSSNAGAVAYASSTQTLLACAAQRWTVVPLPKGGPGPKGDTGATGAAGPAGAHGADGKTPLVVVAEEPEGAHCPNGGSRVDVGLDLNGNGKLDESELTSSTYICDGLDGSDASVDDTLQDLVLSLTQTEHDRLVVVEDASAANKAEVSVALRARPPGAKGVRVQSSGPSVLVNGAPYFDMVFTADDYATPQTLTITTPTDQNLDEPAGAVLTIGLCETVCDIATFTGARGVAVAPREDDVQRIIVSASRVSVAEGGSKTFDVRLAFEPLANAAEVLSLSTSDSGAATGVPTSLSFTAANYATPINVTVTGVNDPDVLSETSTLTLQSNLASTPSSSVVVQVTDDDTPVILLSNGGTTLNEAPQSASFNVTLGFDPSGSLTVNVVSEDATKVTVSPATLTFNSNNYQVGQPVQVTTVSDDDVRNEDIDITLSASGVQTDGVYNVTVLDDDDQGLVVGPVVKLHQGSKVAAPVHLAFAPTSPLVITASNASGYVVLDQTTLTFDSTNYATDQYFQISISPDAVPGGNPGSLTLSVTSPQGSSPPEGSPSLSIPMILE